MMRKITLSLVTVAALGATALAPNTASAHWGGGHWGGHWGHWGGYRFFGPGLRVYAGPAYGGCLVRRWVYTPYGPVLRWVNRCY